VTTGQGRVCETGERRKREGGMVPRSFSSPPLINLVQFLLLRENPGLNNLERKEPHASYRGSRLFERMNYCARFSPYSHKETCQNVCRICVKKGCSKWDSMLPGLLFKRSSDPWSVLQCLAIYIYAGEVAGFVKGSDDLGKERGEGR